MDASLTVETSQLKASQIGDVHADNGLTFLNAADEWADWEEVGI